MKNYSENAQKVYERLYLQKDEEDQPIEDIETCNARVANYIAKNPTEEKEFYKLLQHQIFRPNTPTMCNAGVNPRHSLAACFVLGLEDSMESIIEMWNSVARIYEGGGGAGIPITNLREENAPIGTGGFASGPVSYTKVIQAISDQVKSGGRKRRAANLLSFWYRHPDIMKLISLKDSNNDFSAMNVSVLADDQFMQGIENSDHHTSLVSPNKKGSSSFIRTNDIWKAIIEQAWKTGDPGMLFYDTINRYNPLPSLGSILTGNPCSEVVLQPWSACILGHINLNTILDHDPLGERLPTINWPLYESFIEIAVRFLNRIIDASSFPNKKFKQMMDKTRPIGLGMMGFADILYKMRVPYNSQKAIHIFDALTNRLTVEAWVSSQRLAEDEGICIEVPKEDEEHFLALQEYYGIDHPSTKIANSTVTCLAPTGSTAISADCSFSFEPHFAVTFDKYLEDTKEVWTFANQEFKNACKDEGIELTKDIIERIKNNKGSIQGMDDLFSQELQSIFITAHDIDWKSRIDMQAAGQNNITMAISSTVNLSESATVEDIADVYKYAWEQELKGITVYRDGCKDDQPINFGKKKVEVAENINATVEIQQPQERPIELQGRTRKVQTGSGTLYLTINEMNGVPFEVFATLGKSGRSAAAKAEAVGRLVSLAFRSGVSVRDVVRQLEGIGGDYQIFQEGGLVKSIPDAVAKALTEMYLNKENSIQLNYYEYKNDGELEKTKTEEFKTKLDNIKQHVGPGGTHHSGEVCPHCGNYTLKRDIGCRGGICVSCGYSNCG